jgi:putative membrane protein
LNPGSLSQQDALFVQQAMNSGLQEIAEGNLAIQQSGDHVAGRNFGRWMAADHTHLNDEILAVAQLRGAQVSATAPTIPTALSNSETGDQFVSVYATEQVVDHQQAIMLFTAEANGGTDVNLVALARAALPLLNAHLLGAQDLVTAFPANDTMSDNTTGGTTVNDGSGDQTVAGNDQTNDNGSGDTTTTDGTNDGTTDQTVVDQANTDGLTDATTTDGTTDGTLTIADMINNAGDNNTTVNDMAGTVPGAQPQDLVMTAAGMSAGEPVTAAVLMPDFQTT